MSLADVRIITGAYDALLALIYPQPCAVCGRSVESRDDGVVCSACWQATILFRENDVLCWKCGAFTPATVPVDKLPQVRCGKCDTEHFSAARACGRYEDGLRASILALKLEPHLAKRLVEIMLDTQRRSPIDEAELIIPVPLHTKRERLRGHNQAAIIARELARKSDLPIEEAVLVRSVNTERHRAGMDAKARRQSVADAFVVRQPQLICERRVLLIDDVFTTGATVSECARALKAAGAADVYVLTIARA